jgi:hypothetical protein
MNDCVAANVFEQTCEIHVVETRGCVCSQARRHALWM